MRAPTAGEESLVRVLRNTKGELLRDRLDALLSVTKSSWTEEALLEILSFLEKDLPRSLSELVSLEGKRESAPIMDLTDILLLFRGLTGSGGVGVFGGEGGNCWGVVSVHVEDLREKEKKDFDSELRELKALLLLPGRGPYIAHDRLFD